MKNRVSLLVLGFSIGIGLSALGMKSNGVQAAPMQPLTSVAHDATLAGAGTTASPLGVAAGGVGTNQLANLGVTAGKLSNGAVGTNQLGNAAVTAAKLAALTPTSGQFLSYNGTGLAWQAPPSGGGGLKVVDANGQLVGFPGDYANTVTRNFGAFWGSQVSVTAAGFLDFGMTLYYESADCSGTGYVQVVGSSALATWELGTVGTILYFYAMTDGTERTPQTAKVWNGGQVQCYTIFSSPLVLDVPLTVDVATLGLVTPFHLSQ